MAVTSEDDGFREIQLNGKQLVFLFMAVTVVSVVIFLSGVLVGRGVRAERAEAVQPVAADAAVPLPPHVAAAAPDEGDPRKAAPPSPAGEEASSKEQASRDTGEEQPPVAINRTPPRAPETQVRPAEPPAPKPAEGAAAKPAPPSTPAAPAKTPQPAQAPPAPAASAARQAQPVTTDSAKPADLPSDTAARAGYAVQVAAVNARGEADAIVKRLVSKGYSNAYIEDPKGQVTMFRVRVGTFKTRREAQTAADRLRKEEKFKPWVTR